MTLTTGASWVKLQAYGDEEIVRRVVAETDAAVLVCTEDEFSRASREQRDPRAIGFLKEFVLESFASQPEPPSEGRAETA